MADIGAVKLLVDLSTSRATWSPDNATTGEYALGKDAKLVVQAHLAYSVMRQLETFDLDFLGHKQGAKFANLILRGDNGDEAHTEKVRCSMRLLP